MTNPNVRPDLEALKVLLERVSLPVRAVDMPDYAELLDRRDAKIALTTEPALLVAAVNALPDLIAHIERLQNALKPFAAMAEKFNAQPDGPVMMQIDFAHFRNARATLSQGTSND